MLGAVAPVGLGGGYANPLSTEQTEQQPSGFATTSGTVGLSLGDLFGYQSYWTPPSRGWSVKSPFNRTRPGSAPVASPVPTTFAPSAFDALGGDGSSQYISQLIASIQGQAPQTLGWFESGTRPAQLFGLPY